MEGLGIPSAAALFTDFGYQQRDMLTFPAKKLQVSKKGIFVLQSMRQSSRNLHAREDGKVQEIPRSGPDNALARVFPAAVSCPVLLPAGLLVLASRPGAAPRVHL